MFPSDAKTLELDLTVGNSGYIFEYTGDGYIPWTVLGTRITYEQLNWVNPTYQSEIATIADGNGVVIDSLQSRYEDMSGAGRAYAVNTEGEQSLMTYPVLSDLNFAITNQTGADGVWHAVVTYVERPYASSTEPMTNDVATLLGGAFIFLTTMAIIMFYFRKK